MSEQKKIELSAEMVWNLKKLERVLRYLIMEKDFLPDRHTFAEGYLLCLAWVNRLIAGKIKMGYISVMPDISEVSRDLLLELMDSEIQMQQESSSK